MFLLVHAFSLCGSLFGLMYMMIESDDVQTNREHELVGKPSLDFQSYLTEIQSNVEKMQNHCFLTQSHERLRKPTVQSTKTSLNITYPF